MKQTFVVEIDSSDYVKPIDVEFLTTALREGFYERAMPNLSICSIKEIPVEQSVEPLKDQEETPKNIVQLDYSPSEGYSVKYTREEQEESSCYEDERALDYMEIARTNKPSKFEW